MTLIAVTGATGRLGSRVARRLADRGSPQRLVVRDRNRAPQLPGALVVQAAYGDGEAARQALDGASTLLMVSAAESVDRVAEHCAFVDAVADAGVGHIVYTSFVGAAPTATYTLARDHWTTEEYIRRSGVAYTFLRDNLYQDVLPAFAGEAGVIRGPAGHGRVAAVAEDDIADAAAAILLSPDDHAGRTYNLTGPQALDFDEIAAILTRATGREISYLPETIEEAYASRASYGAELWRVDAWVSTYTAIAAGELALVTQDIPNLTGHPATPLEDYLSR